MSRNSLLARRISNYSALQRRLRLEPLEDRRLLAITVDTLLDVVDDGDGLTSLREAIATVNTTSEDEIDFSVTGKINLLSGELEITDTLTITGPGRDLLTIDAGGQSRAMNVPLNAGDLTLAGITLTGGRITGHNLHAADNTYSGGGIRFLSNGTLTITDSTISGNATEGDYARGGAVYTRFGQVALNHSTLSGNSTKGLRASGGGLFVDSSTVAITGSTVSGNWTEGDYANGGGIYTDSTGSGDVTITNSQVNNNRTEGSQAVGGAIGTLFGDVTVTLSEVNGNVGGGIHTIAGDVTLIGSTLNRFTTEGEVTSGSGSGIRTDTGAATLTNSTIRGRAGEHLPGNGIYSTSGDVTLTDSMILDNWSTSPGAGIRANSGSVMLLRSRLDGNQVNGGQGEGGAIRMLSGNLTLIDSTLTNNFVMDGRGADGGAVSSANGVVTIVGSTISNNGITGTYAKGGGISASGPLTIENSTVSGNTTSSTRSRIRGGGIYAGGDLRMANSTVTGNSAGMGGGIYASNSYNLTFDITNSIIAGNNDSHMAPDLWVGVNTLPSISHTLIGDTTGSGIDETTGTGNLLNVDPLLAPLADNGGPTQTHALQHNSPAIDAGDPSIAYREDEFDQRGPGFYRVDTRGSQFRIDIGAFESQNYFRLWGDADHDGAVAGSDLLAVTNNFNFTGGFDTPLLGDATADDYVDGSDLLAVTNSFGNVFPPREEPSIGDDADLQLTDAAFAVFPEVRTVARASAAKTQAVGDVGLESGAEELLLLGGFWERGSSEQQESDETLAERSATNDSEQATTFAGGESFEGVSPGGALP